MGANEDMRATNRTCDKSLELFLWAAMFLNEPQTFINTMCAKVFDVFSAEELPVSRVAQLLNIDYLSLVKGILPGLYSFEFNFFAFF